MKNNDKRLAYATVALATLLLSACRNENRCNTPIGASACQIDPNSPLYNKLNNVGGYEYIVGGNHGIFVMRTGLNDFVAYERTCPQDHSAAVDAADGWDGTVLECPVCGSKFNTLADGMPLGEGSTSCPLYQYGTSYEGGTLYIY